MDRFELTLRQKGAIDLPRTVHMWRIVRAIAPNPQVAARVKGQCPASPKPREKSGIENLSSGVELDHYAQSDVDNVDMPRFVERNPLGVLEQRRCPAGRRTSSKQRGVARWTQSVNTSESLGSITGADKHVSLPVNCQLVGVRQKRAPKKLFLVLRRHSGSTRRNTVDGRRIPAVNFPEPVRGAGKINGTPVVKGQGYDGRYPSGVLASVRIKTDTGNVRGHGKSRRELNAVYFKSGPCGSFQDDETHQDQPEP
jgi:hypothetical protein